PPQGYQILQIRVQRSGDLGFQQVRKSYTVLLMYEGGLGYQKCKLSTHPLHLQGVLPGHQLSQISTNAVNHWCTVSSKQSASVINFKASPILRIIVLPSFSQPRLDDAARWTDVFENFLSKKRWPDGAAGRPWYDQLVGNRPANKSSNCLWVRSDSLVKVRIQARGFMDRSCLSRQDAWIVVPLPPIIIPTKFVRQCKGTTYHGEGSDTGRTPSS
ncbi:hypothetical protein BDFG_06990, partial [Blastomyces dermatitidis ATCC 26199]